MTGSCCHHEMMLCAILESANFTLIDVSKQETAILMKNCAFQGPEEGKWMGTCVNLEAISAKIILLCASLPSNTLYA